ncbi:hypothetical protein R1flu_015151 [Riccia fluitans]|uniref:Uncharacterized protein n=1 Tax=Riccia fluitans TaxID=41844 RepID=A0ABD1YII4_9MARC
MGNESNITAYLKQVNELSKDLAAYDETQSEELIVSIILNDLPFTYSTLKLISGEKILHILADVIARLRQEEDSIKTDEGNKTIDALYIKFRRAIQDRRNGKVFVNTQCHKYGGFGQETEFFPLSSGTFCAAVQARVA